MDITQELKQIALNEKGAKQVLDEMVQQKENIRKKEYLVKVIQSVNQLENAIKRGLFEDFGLYYLEIAHNGNYDGTYNMAFIPSDENKQYIGQFTDMKTMTYTEATIFLSNLSENIGDFDSDVCSYKVKNNTRDFIPLKEGIRDILFDTLLSPELLKLKIESNFENEQIDQIVKDTISQKEELDDKNHILEVIDLANQLENLVKEKYFKEFGIESIEIGCDFDYEGGYIIRLNSVYTNDGLIQDADGTQTEIFEEFFSNISKLNDQFVSEKLMEHGTLDLKPGVSKQFIDLFLSERLKVALEYNKMQIELPVSEESNVKKIKL